MLTEDARIPFSFLEIRLSWSDESKFLSKRSTSTIKKVCLGPKKKKFRRPSFYINNTKHKHTLLSFSRDTKEESHADGTCNLLRATSWFHQASLMKEARYKSIRLEERIRDAFYYVCCCFFAPYLPVLLWAIPQREKLPSGSCCASRRTMLLMKRLGVTRSNLVKKKISTGKNVPNKVNRNWINFYVQTCFVAEKKLSLNCSSFLRKSCFWEDWIGSCYIYTQ